MCTVLYKKNIVFFFLFYLTLYGIIIQCGVIDIKIGVQNRNRNGMVYSDSSAVDGKLIVAK